MKPHFLITSIDIIDRHTEPLYENLKEGDIVLVKHEELTIKCQFTSSGNTSNISNAELAEEFMRLLEVL